MKKPHYAFLICAATTLTFFYANGLGCNAFSIYMPYVLKEYGISNTQSSSILLTRSLFGFLATAVSGWYYRAFSLRNGILIAGISTVLGYILFGTAPGYATVLAGSALVGVGFGLGATLPVSMMLNRWFRQKRNTAMSISAMGSTFAMIGIPSLITWGIQTHGLRPSFLVHAAAIALSAGVAFLIFRSDPSELGLEPYGSDAVKAAGTAQGTTTVPKQRVITRTDWLWLIPALLLLGAVANPGYNHLSVFLNGQSFTPESIAVAFSIGSACACAGKFLFGVIADRFSTFYCNFIYGFMSIAGLILLCISHSIPVMYCGMAFFCTGISIAITGPPAWAGDLSEPEQYDLTIQRFQKMYTLGSLVFTLMPGMIADRCGGSYLTAFWIFTGFTVYLVAAVQRQYIKNR
ncbi:MAG: MFS transporter [Lachnospiraceae bacterium]|nr:MFS transporter [Lachnospiraceae bacterium]